MFESKMSFRDTSNSSAKELNLYKIFIVGGKAGVEDT